MVCIEYDLGALDAADVLRGAVAPLDCLAVDRGGEGDQPCGVVLVPRDSPVLEIR